MKRDIAADIAGHPADDPADDPGPIAIIGAGFSGTIAAIRLRRQLPACTIHLFDRRAGFGRGAAYAAQDGRNLLNVRCSNMSAFPEEPDHFERWLAAQPAGASAAFAPRALYGSYLGSLLSQEVDRSGGRLRLERDHVTRLHRREGGWQVGCSGGRRVDVGAVVIAAGNLPCATPDDGVVFHDPWAPDVTAGLRPGAPVLIVGTGLTMVDLALGLRNTGFTGPILALSRRGLVPQRHAAAMPAWPAPASLTQPGRTISALLHALRAAVREAAAQGVDWRAVIDGLRPVTAALWRGLSTRERARFLRHARPYWDTHRHRMAPTVADGFAAMTAAGQVRLLRGRVTGIERGDTARVSIRQHGAAGPETLAVQRVIFATGAGSGMAHDPLLTSLLAAGMALGDPNGLGLQVTEALRVIGGDGAPTPGLWALGPVVRGSMWECTAVPDIRIQACIVADGISRDDSQGGRT